MLGRVKLSASAGPLEAPSRRAHAQMLLQDCQAGCACTCMLQPTGYGAGPEAAARPASLQQDPAQADGARYSEVPGCAFQLGPLKLLSDINLRRVLLQDCRSGCLHSCTWQRIAHGAGPEANLLGASGHNAAVDGHLVKGWAPGPAGLQVAGVVGAGVCQLRLAGRALVQRHWQLGRLQGQRAGGLWGGDWRRRRLRGRLLLSSVCGVRPVSARLPRCLMHVLAGSHALLSEHAARRRAAPDTGRLQVMCAVPAGHGRRQRGAPAVMHRQGRSCAAGRLVGSQSAEGARRVEGAEAARATQTVASAQGAWAVRAQTCLGLRIMDACAQARPATAQLVVWGCAEPAGGPGRGGGLGVGLCTGVLGSASWPASLCVQQSASG